jgi:hypothetical protein
MNDDFYIGWQDQAPPRLARRIKVLAGIIMIAITACAFVFGKLQQTIGISVFEWGTTKEFTGILMDKPYPHLLVPPPAEKGSSDFSTYLLVNPFKFGFERETAQRFAGRSVALRGTLIYRNGQAMIEVNPGTVTPVTETAASHRTGLVNLGRQTLRGEIVDSKCYLGVMNPGEFIPHRACAIRCISGGIPPVLVVRRENGPPLHFLLVSPEGLPVNKYLLDLVAEPVEITGEVQRQGDLLILRANPADFRRI